MSHITPLTPGIQDHPPPLESTVRIRREAALKWPPSSLQYERVIKPLSEQKPLWDLLSNMDSMSKDKIVSVLSRVYDSGSGGSSFGGNLLFEILKNNPALLTNPQFARIVMKLLSSGGHPGVDFFLGVDPKDLVDVLSVSFTFCFNKIVLGTRVQSIVLLIVCH